MRQSLGRSSVVGAALAYAILGCGAPVAEGEGPRRGGPDSVVAPEGASVLLTSSTTGAPDEASVEQPEAPLPSGPRLFAYDGYETIVQKPEKDAPMIGLVRAGQSVPIASEAPLKGPGVGHCKGGFFAVKPRGFICAGRHSTLDGRDPRVRAAAEVLPKPDAPVPFKVGVMAVSAPQYQRVPTRAEQEKHEPGLVDHLAKVAAASVPIPKGVTGTFDTKKAGRGPSTAFTTYVDFAKPSLVSKEEAYEGRKMAFAAELDAEGRTFLVTPDLTLVPKDKVVFVDMPKLQGVELAKSQLKLPFGYAWIEDVPKLRQRDNGEMVETGDVYGRQAFVQIEGPLVRGKKGGNFWKTADGTYVRHELLSIFKPRTDRPPGVGKSDKWIDVRVTWGSLIAYEGDKPVYATAISPGVDGITQRARGHTTVLGTYTVGWKLVSADMSGVEKKKEWAVDDVPFVNYFKDSYAVHGAWWHNDFGRPKSHGCVNVAPNDAHWLWHWMEPGLPEGWYAVAAFRPEVKGTTIVIRP